MCGLQFKRRDGSRRFQAVVGEKPDAASSRPADEQGLDCIWPQGEGLPAFCGAVSSPQADTLVIGVAHSDGGVSSRAVQQLIQQFEPHICLVELDRQRFSRLIAAKRNLPFAYAPPRGSQFRPNLIITTVRQGLFNMLGLASQVAVTADDGGSEFFTAFQAAEDCGAFVVPGDMPVAEALDGFSASFRRGLADPLRHIASGFVAFKNAGGGVTQRPHSSTSSGWACGTAVPVALAAENGGRTGPLVRSTALGLGFALGLNYLLGVIVSSHTETLEQLQEPTAVSGLGNLLLGLVLLIGAVAVSAFSHALLQKRDEHMVAQLKAAVYNVHSLRGEIQQAGVDRQAASTTLMMQPAPVWLRWVKQSLSTWQRGKQAAQERGIAEATLNCNTRNSEQVHPSIMPNGLHKPQMLPVISGLRWRPEQDASSLHGYVPLFTAKRTLDDGEVRRLSLFEPRFLRLVDSMATSAADNSSFILAIVHTLHGSERPAHVTDWSTPGGNDAMSESPLTVEVDALVSGTARLARVQVMKEAQGEDGRRRWRLSVQGTSQQLRLCDCQVVSDDLGALWAARKAPEQNCKPVTSAKQDIDGGQTRLRSVAVVGLLHVNGIVQGLRQQP